MTSDVLILGGGPAGMAAAMELHRAGKKSTVIEKAPQVGGLAKTLTIKRPEGIYRTDIGPHRFYSKNRYLYDFIEDLLGEEWIKVPRQTRFLVDGTYYFYPIQLGNVLRGMGLRGSGAVIRDFLVSRIRHRCTRREPQNFEEYVLMNFGRALGKFNMLNYTEKIWGIPCREISVDWALQRIGGLSLTATLCKALGKKAGGPKTLVDTFYYPKFGSGTIYEAIRHRIEEQGNVVLTESEPARIEWKEKRVTNVRIRTREGEKILSPSTLISSIPITRCIELFHPSPPPEILSATKNLRFRNQVYIFLTIDQEQVTRDNWLYFPGKEIPFGRITEMKNFSKEMCPPGKTSLFIEFFCFENDSIWNMAKDDLLRLTTEWLERLHLINSRSITSWHYCRAENVYPIYDLHYKKNVEMILRWMDTFENFFAIGRPGRFRYTNQDHSLEMGILAARSVIEGRRREIENVGREQEYFERGYLPKDQCREMREELLKTAV